MHSNALCATPCGLPEESTSLPALQRVPERCGADRWWRLGRLCLCSLLFCGAWRWEGQPLRSAPRPPFFGAGVLCVALWTAGDQESDGFDPDYASMILLSRFRHLYRALAFVASGTPAASISNVTKPAALRPHPCGAAAANSAIRAASGDPFQHHLLWRQTNPAA